MTLLLWIAVLASPAPAPPVRAPDAGEVVEVTLVEVVMQAADRKGHPVRDLKPEDLVVREGGAPRRVGFVEPFLQSNRESAAGDAAKAAALYVATGRPVAPHDLPVLPPRPARRFVLAFDLANSRARARGAWKQAASAWAGNSLAPGDRVAVVLLRSGPEWRLPFTNDPAAVSRALEALDLEGAGSSRDRRREMSRLWDEVTPCADTATAGRRSGSPESCAVTVLEPWVAQWNTESRETAAALRTLTGQLSAVPGRKEVLLFSDGFLTDPTVLATSTYLAAFGAGSGQPPEAIGRMLGPDVANDVEALHDAARAAGVVFFTFDTRSAADRGGLDNVERDRTPQAGTLGADPWSDAYSETDGTLETLSEQTGGRVFRGARDVEGQLARASEAYDGLYVVGFYRPQGSDPAARLRIDAVRRGVDLSYTRRASRRGPDPRPARLDLSIRKPEPTGRADRQWLPVVIDLPTAALPLRSAGGTRGCRLGYFVQASHPDGTVVTEAFHEAVVAFEGKTAGEHAASYRQLVKLDLPPGRYRIRARVADDRQELSAERAIDLTLEVGLVR